METKESIDAIALTAHTALEAEYFDVVPDGAGQHRVLKEGKTIDNFNAAHAIIWREHENALIASGYLEPPVEPEPSRDLAAELDALKARVDSIEKT